MIDQFFKTVNLVAVNKLNHDHKMQDFKSFANRKKPPQEKESHENQSQETFEKKKQTQSQKHWLWDNKWFKLLKTLLITFLLLKATTLFWNELAKLIKAAKNVEKAAVI